MPGRPGAPPGRPRPPGAPAPRPRTACWPSDAFCCLGIMAGFGRGMPGTPNEPPGRGMRFSPPGRGAPPSGRGRRCCPMPWDDAKGLLPGRGVPAFRPAWPGVGAPPPAGRGRGVAPPGRGPGAAGRCDGVDGRAAGRGAGAGAGAGVDGRAAGRGAGVDGRAAGAGAGAAAAGAAAAGACGAGAGLGVGVGAAGRGADAGRGAGASDALVAYISLRRRTTGGSMVDEADLTYSPISPSFVRSSLLSIPRSLATSCTRGLAATTLLGRPTPHGMDQLVGCCAHR